MSYFRKMRLSAIAVAMIAANGSVNAETPEQVLKGKTVSMYISSGVGGLNDQYGRLVADHISKYLPGNPTVLPRNMPGAGGLKATIYVYNQAPRDGTAMGVVQRSVATQPLLGAKGADYNPLEFHWIGSTATEVSVGVAYNAKGITTIQDTLSRELVVGASGENNDGGAFPRVVNYFIGTKIKPIHGYIGGADISLAMERGEVFGRFGWSWGSVKAREGARLKDGTIKVLIQMGIKKASDLDAPLILDLAKTEKDRKAMEVIFASTTIGWPSLLPPKVPSDMVKAYRDAYKETMKDPKFVQAAQARNLELDPLSGEEIQSIIANVYAAPTDVIELARKSMSLTGKVERVKILEVDGKISNLEQEGGLLTLVAADKTVKAHIADETRITIGGDRAKVDALKVGMSCSMALVASGAIANKLTCK